MCKSTIINPNRCPFPASKEEIEKLYNEDLKSLGDIAKNFNCSRQRLARWMEYWKLDRRESIIASKLRCKQLGKERGPNWQGGKWYSKHGKTWFIYAPNHPKCQHNGGVPEHILIVENFIKRNLNEEELVHHKNAVRSDNRTENLCIMDRSSHLHLHRILGDVGIKLINNNELDLVLKSITNKSDLKLIKDVYYYCKLIVEREEER